MKLLNNIIWNFYIFIIILFTYSIKWTIITYPETSFDQILFHLTNPISGIEKRLIYSYVLNSLIPSIVLYVFFSFFFFLLIKKFKNRRYIIKRNFSIITVIILLFCFYKIGAIEYILLSNKNSMFIEDNYIEPSKVKLTFPEEKRNLIYIFVESLESTYLSKNFGGQLEENLIPELYGLSKENISFSDTDLLGGAYEINGTSWTTAGLVAQTSGIHLKLPKSQINKTNISNFMKGVYSIGDVLDKEGYNQTVMLGSSAEFGNIETYFENHGNYKIYDYNSAIANKKIDDDYFVWWGYEDSKLFEYAKEELVDLYNKDEPFNLTLFTINTHSIGGYLEKECKSKYKYKDNYSNVISCTSKQMYDFVLWCREQDFYKNTTIVIVGDHLSMDPNFFKEIDKKDRRIFNLFINADINNDDFDYNNREFSSLDMYPTTLASLGVIIEGDKLGLGTNLFSKEKTLIEKYGLEEVNKQLSYKSDFYNKNIFCYK